MLSTCCTVQYVVLALLVPVRSSSHAKIIISCHSANSTRLLSTLNTLNKLLYYRTLLCISHSNLSIAIRWRVQAAGDDLHFSIVRRFLYPTKSGMIWSLLPLKNLPRNNLLLIPTRKIATTTQLMKTRSEKKTTCWAQQEEQVQDAECVVDYISHAPLCPFIHP